MIKKRKKGQMLFPDFLLGLTIFLIVMAISGKLIVDMTADNKFEQAYKENLQVSESLLTTGMPTNWTKDNIIIPGIVNDQRLNITKLEEFEKLDYELSKTLLNTKSEFLFYFKNATEIINISNCSYGYNINYTAGCQPNIQNIDMENLVHTDRYIIHNGEIISMRILTWN